jgi:hypothetical protein
MIPERDPARFIEVEDGDVELWSKLEAAQAENGPVISLIAEFRENIEHKTRHELLSKLKLQLAQRGVKVPLI